MRARARSCTLPFSVALLRLRPGLLVRATCSGTFPPSLRPPHSLVLIGSHRANSASINENQLPGPPLAPELDLQLSLPRPPPSVLAAAHSEAGCCAVTMPTQAGGMLSFFSFFVGGDCCVDRRADGSSSEMCDLSQAE